MNLSDNPTRRARSRRDRVRTQHERSSLQHEAEHTRPRKKGSVMSYLAILFAAAFLLLLMSYFMQQRVNREAVDNLQQTSNSAAQTLEQILLERDELKEQSTQLEEQVAALQSQAEADQADLSDAKQAIVQAQEETDALNKLNQLRSLYNQGRYQDARELLDRNPDMGAILERVNRNQLPGELELYDPLATYEKLVRMLG